MCECQFCVDVTPVSHSRQIKPGSHLKFGRHKLCGNYMYTQHAIVIDVNTEANAITVIHFAHEKDEFIKKGTIREETLTTKDFRKDCYLVNHPGHQNKARIIDRAKSLLAIQSSNLTGKDGKMKYNLLQNNSEHLAIYCVTGNKRCCVQLENMIRDVLETGFTVLSGLIKLLLDNASHELKQELLRLCSGLYDANHIFTISTVAIAAFYILRLYNNFDEGIVCQSCFWQRLMGAVSGCVSANAVTSTAYGAFAILAVIKKSGQYFRIWDKIYPNSDIKCLNLNSFGELSQGDIINYRLYLVPHDAIVTKCSPTVSFGFVKKDNNVFKFHVMETDSYLSDMPVLRYVCWGMNQIPLLFAADSLKNPKQVESLNDYCYLLPKTCISQFRFNNLSEEQLGRLDAEGFENILESNGVLPLCSNCSLLELQGLKSTFKELSSDKLKTEFKQDLFCFLEDNGANFRTEQTQLELRRIVKHLIRCKKGFRSPYKPWELSTVGIEDLQTTLVENEINPISCHATIDELIERKRETEDNPKCFEVDFSRANNLSRKTKRHEIYDFLEERGIAFRQGKNFIELQFLLQHMMKRSNKLAHLDYSEKHIFEMDVEQLEEILIKNEILFLSNKLSLEDLEEMERSELIREHWDFLEFHGVCYRQGKRKEELIELIAHLRDYSEKNFNEKEWETIPLSEVQETDVIEINIDGRYTKAFVTSLNKATLEIVHYDFQNGINLRDIADSEKRVVKRDTVEFDLQKTRILRYDFSRYPDDKVRTGKEVCQLALARVGETNWTLTNIWSNDLGRDCKLCD